MQNIHLKVINDLYFVVLSGTASGLYASEVRYILNTDVFLVVDVQRVNK
ncbi:MAG: hypothetical protein JW917_05455 [Ignavibacteria bacterium]|nr:hypothetical protein [Ignavibacteria bacterium]